MRFCCVWCTPDTSHTTLHRLVSLDRGFEGSDGGVFCLAARVALFRQTQPYRPADRFVFFYLAPLGDFDDALVDQLYSDRSRGVHQLAPPLRAPVAHRARGLAGSHGLAAPACAKHGQDHIADALLVRKGVVRDDEKG